MSHQRLQVRYKSWFRILLTPVLLVVAWHFLAQSGLFSSYLLPAPSTVLKSFINLVQTGVLSKHIVASLSRVLSGFFISCVAGILLAGLLTYSNVMKDLFTAPLTFFRMIPPLAMIPLLMLWLGIGNATQLSIIILASFFPIFLNAQAGFKRVTPQQQELAKSLSLPAGKYVTHIVLPAAIPSIITGARLAFGYSWRALIGAELIAASSGLGYLIIDAQELQRTDVVMVGIVVIGVIGWALDSFFYHQTSHWLRRRFPEVAQ